MPFRDRADAGNRLAQRLLHLRGADTVVLGLPRGGVPVAAAVAEALEAPLDVIVARKLGVPHRPEVAMGAVGEGGPLVVDHEMVRRFAVSTQDLADVERRERAEVARRVLAFRGTLQRLELTGKTVIVVDAGLAPGATARAACQVARAQGARRVIMAVPVAPPDALARLHADADELVCLESPTPFFAISQWYDDFTQTTDREVVDLLRRSRTRVATSPVVPRGATAGRVGTGGSAEVTVQAGQVRLPGNLTVPAGPRGFVLFAHGSGSGRRSPRNRSVAVLLNEAGLGTLLFDLLTDSEAADRRNVFDIPMLADRLSAADRWLRTELDPLGAPVGYFGASTGAAAALWAAA
ncbi:MAG: phosphoribosyltransferase family protein, partial [Actinomycetes bacterium]